MSCCSPDSSNHTTVEPCPECALLCKSVAMRTLYHQVRFPDNQIMTSDNYYFCRNKSCSVAYFTLTGLIIPKQHLRASADIESGESLLLRKLILGIHV